MDLLVKLAGTDPDLNGPVALPLCIVWAVAALVAIYYRRRYGPNVGYYSAMTMATILMTILQLFLFLLSYNNPSVMIARQVVAALGTLLLTWLLIAVLISWSESSRVMRISPENINPTYQATRKISEQPPRLPKLNFLSTPINELEIIYPNSQRLTQPIPEATGPYRATPQENDAFPAYRAHFSQPRFRYFTTSLQIANTTAFIAAVTGRIAAVFSQQADLELPFITISCILIGFVLVSIIISASLFWRIGRNMSIATRRPLLVLVLLSGLEIPRCVSLALRSANMRWYIGSEVFTAVWLVFALWPGMLKNVTEFTIKEDSTPEQCDLIRVDQNDPNASSSNSSAATPNKRNLTRFATRNITEGTTNAETTEPAPLTSPRFAMTSRLARTQSVLYDFRRTSISSLKQLYNIASPFSTDTAESAEEIRRKSEEKLMQERKRWTITMSISQGESLIDMLQRDLQEVFDDNNNNNNNSDNNHNNNNNNNSKLELASSLQHPPAAAATAAITRNRV
jgi:hypothetical protein